jgi:tRNA nucleotidyltransferase (CCA-adding enzyme)
VTGSFIQHQDVAAFANDRVNLKRDRVKAYREQVQRLRGELAEHVNADPGFSLVKMLGSGSVTKGTALSTINDMDVAVYVRSGEEPEDEANLLPWMRDRLREAYPKFSTERFELQQHCVKIKFRYPELHVDVVPVLFEGDEDDKGFLITEDSGDRVLTSVPLHVEFIRARKRAQPVHFRQVVRLVKWWVRLQKAERDDFRFKSFMTELICAHLADGGLDMSDYPHSLEQFFGYVVKSGLRQQIAFTDNYKLSKVLVPADAPIKIVDPVNPENNVASRYTDADRSAIVEAARDALGRLLEAHESDTKGRAVSCWQDVLGPSFQGN